MNKKDPYLKLFSRQLWIGTGILMIAFWFASCTPTSRDSIPVGDTVSVISPPVVDSSSLPDDPVLDKFSVDTPGKPLPRKVKPPEMKNGSGAPGDIRKPVNPGDPDHSRLRKEGGHNTNDRDVEIQTSRQQALIPHKADHDTGLMKK